MKKIKPGKTVLLIDDDLKIRKMLSFLFLAQGFTVKEAENGSTALDILGDVNPDVIIVDLMMPVMDGFEFCKKIREDIHYKKTPLIILSALTATEYRPRIESLDIFGCFEKPFRSSDVLQKAIEAIQ